MPNSSRVVVSWFLVLALHLVEVTAAAALDGNDVRRVAAEARELARQGRDADAEARLQKGLEECRPGSEGVSCRAALGLALGGLAEQQARRGAGDQTGRLGLAFTRYEGVLAESPAHAPTLARLSRLYVQQGDVASAETLLTKTLQQFPGQDTVALLLGDLYRDLKRWDDAMRAYRVEVDRNPTSDVARRRLVEAHVSGLPAHLAELRRVLAELESGFPAVAELGHRAIIHRLYQTNAAAAEASLVQLAAILAATRRLSLAALDDLPTGWAPPALTHLRGYLAASHQRPAPGWWLDRPERRHGLALAGLALGHQALLDGDAKLAAARWEVAEEISPEYEAYRYHPPLKGLPVVRLDLQTALALHYFRFPSLDPMERKFNRVVNSLFQSKAGAYKLDDLEGIQRHHTILGVILAEKGAWRTNHFALNAIFQLDNALKTAARRDSANGLYQPLPELRARLAEGYQRLGEPATARATYLSAAEAYLDSDAIEPAGRMLKAARALLGEPSPERQRAAQIERVLGAREEIARAAGAQLDPSRGEYVFGATGRHGWLHGQPLPPLAPAFLARQRFKALSDLASRVGNEGHAKAAEEIASHAFGIAIAQVKHFTGPADIVRIDRIRATVTRPRVLEPKPLVLGGALGAPQGAKTWQLTDPVTLRPTQVRLDADDVLVARIVDDLRADSVLLSTDFVVKSGRVTVREGNRSDEIRVRIEKIPGVDGIRTSPGLPTPAAGPAAPATKR